MLWAIRLGLVLGAVFVIRPAGRILAVVFVADLSQPGFLAELGMFMVLFVGLVALVVSAADRLFSSAWLATFAFMGLGSIGLTRLRMSCSNVEFSIPSYESYLCASPSMIMGLAGICAVFLLMVALRKAWILPKPEQSG